MVITGQPCDQTYQVTGADYAARVQGNRVGSPAATVRFTYDAVGNRVQMDENGTVTRYAANNLNQYTQVGAFAPSHDRNGNLASMGQWLYRYDAMNRLVSASNGKMTAKFYYDAKNRCVARSYQDSGPGLQAPSSTLTLNTYDNWNLIEERAFDPRRSTFAQSARYVHGRRIDEIVVMVNRHGTFYPHHDALGNVTMLTGTDGRLVERYTYSVTGQVAISNAVGKTLTESAVGNRWMFTGREWLAEVGLYDYRNRVYSAELGRFLQTDPIRFYAGDINIYRYVRNRLMIAIDPWGEQEVVVYGIDGGSGDYSHVFTQTIDSGANSVVQGNYPDEVRYDQDLLNDSRTFEIARYNVTDPQVASIRSYYDSQSGLWTTWTNNCGDTSDNALDNAGIDRTADASWWVEFDTVGNILEGLWDLLSDWFLRWFE